MLCFVCDVRGAEDSMYLVICEFLLLKPSLDIANVPEFYKLFYSAKLEVTPCYCWAIEFTKLD